MPQLPPRLKCCDTNQTPKESFDALAKSRSQTGTAIFLVPAPEKGVEEYKAVLVPNLTYKEALKRATTCQAVKWIADSVMTHDQLVEERKAKACSNYNCGRNWDGCPQHCICPGPYFDCE